MTFYALALSVSLAVWFLAMMAASLVGLPLRHILFGKHIVTSRRMEQSPAATADALFFLRTLPLFLALVLAAGIVLPAFLRYEPHSAGESISSKLWLLASAGALLLAVIVARSVRMLLATARVEKRWRANSQGELKIAGVRPRLYCVESDSPLLAVTGFLRPRIFVSREVLDLLSPGELRAAVAHEMDHVRRLDNLKQFLLKVTRLPRWLGGSQDVSWTLASEVAADAGALARGASALDLASALVKVAALKRVPALSEQIAASHLLPDISGSPLAVRVQRLQLVLEGHPDCRQSEPVRKPWKKILFVALPVLLYIAAVSAVLPAVHEGLEFLVR
jgi:beta-lactamase regulating signal transducer with metallopeptidase domain